MRRAPATGYDFATKRDYRRKVWATFRDTAKQLGLVRAECDVLLLPSTEGAEIEVALNAGFREDHLHVVDGSPNGSGPAIVATLKRRYPKINTYGVGIVRAALRIRKKGIKIRFANLDLCGQISHRLHGELRTFVRTGCLAPMALVGVTVLRGRESAFMQEILAHGCPERTEVTDDFSRDFDTDRFLDVQRAGYIGWVLAGDDSNSIPMRVERYVSSNGQSFQWAIFMREPKVIEEMHKARGISAAQQLGRRMLTGEESA